MVWMSQRQKELGVKLGFIVTGSGREARVVNILFPDNDQDKPVKGYVRPASRVEVKMWRELSRA